MSINLRDCIITDYNQRLKPSTYCYILFLLTIAQAENLSTTSRTSHAVQGKLIATTNKPPKQSKRSFVEKPTILPKVFKA